jgi:hypothetical protein
MHNYILALTFSHCVHVCSALNSGRLDRHLADNEVTDTSDMQAEVTFMGKDKNMHSMSYRSYLREFQPESISPDLTKYKDIQDLVLNYFSIVKKSARFIHLCQSNSKNTVEALHFENTCLDLIVSLLSRGFYTCPQRLAEGLKISFLTIQSIDKTTSTSKKRKSTSSLSISEKLQSVRPINYVSLPNHGDSSSDEDEDEDEDYALGDEDFGYSETRASTEEQKDPYSNTTDSITQQSIIKGSHGISSNTDLDNGLSGGGVTDEEAGAGAPDLGVLVLRLCRRHDSQCTPATVLDTVFENQR